MVTMRRFYYPPHNRKDDEVDLSSEESRHALKVLRLAVGDRVELFDGQGSVYLGTVIGSARRVTIRIDGELETTEDTGRPLQVIQAMLRGEKMDQVVQKCTELGVSRLIPVFSERSQGRLDRAKAARKVERWQRISLESCKQCLRPRPMEIAFPLLFTDLLQDQQILASELLFFWEKERECTLRDLIFAGDNPLVLLFGPEGGFTDAEVMAAQEAGWKSVSLGNRILRSETASLAGVSLVQYLLGNL